jgi:hypothetical protein
VGSRIVQPLLMDAAHARALELIALRQSWRRQFNERLAALQGDERTFDSTGRRRPLHVVGPHRRKPRPAALELP